MTTLAALLLGEVNNPAPRITYYDDATGERIELSTVTLANWAAKTANMLRDEFGAGPGSTVAVRLPAHWQTAGVLLGIWWAGAELVFGDASTDVAFCTLDDEPNANEVCVLSLDAFGRPAPDLPLGLTDYATAVRVHGDRFAPAGAGPAVDGRSVDEVAGAARESAVAQGITAG
ncbi:TIGR03089 family protein, partial [Mycobacteroides abscessus subsp. massiliense]